MSDLALYERPSREIYWWAGFITGALLFGGAIAVLCGWWFASEYKPGTSCFQFEIVQEHNAPNRTKVTPFRCPRHPDNPQASFPQ